jgi:general secretion pathway protein G
MPQACAGRLRERGFSLVELAVAVAVLAGLLYFLLDRVLYMQEMAEKTEVEETVRAINYALRLEAASRLTRSAEPGRAPLEKDNPIKWLQSPPLNYLGEMETGPVSAKPGYWYFHPAERQLIYKPNHVEHLKIEGGSSLELRFVVLAGGNSAQPSLSPYFAYAWF